MGDPEPAFGPARYLEVLLEQRFPERRFEVVNVAFTAINSHVLLPLAHECAQREGDLWIVYMGNNEMVGPFGAATILGAQTPPRAVVKLVTGLQRTRVGQLGLAIIRKLQRPETAAGSWGGMAMFEKQRVPPDSPKRRVVSDNFAANLNDLLRSGLDAGAGIILNTVAVNLRDSRHSPSVHSDKLSAEQRKQFEAVFQAGIKAQAAADWTTAVTAFEQAVQMDAGFAEAHYRLALCQERVGQLDAARQHYQLACDTDALPFRTDAPENARIRAAAARFAGNRLQLVDAAAVLGSAGGAGVCWPGILLRARAFQLRRRVSARGGVGARRRANVGRISRRDHQRVVVAGILRAAAGPFRLESQARAELGAAAAWGAAAEFAIQQP